MAPIISVVEIDRPPAEVFAYVTDPTRFPEWQDDVVQVRLTAPGPLRVGGRFTTTRRIGPGERDMVQEVAVLDAPHAWSARAVGGAVRPNAQVVFEPLDGGTRSRVTFALDFDGGAMGQVLLPLVRRMTARQAPVSLRHLKERLEAA
jgi:uncharacterized protein YndB with AHSA1/START domain